MSDVPISRYASGEIAHGEKSVKVSNITAMTIARCLCGAEFHNISTMHARAALEDHIESDIGGST